MNPSEVLAQELDRIRLMSAAQAEGLAGVMGPILDRNSPKPQTPEELRKHWRYVFAASALNGLAPCLLHVNRDEYSRPFNESEITGQCVAVADALLAALENLNGPE